MRVYYTPRIGNRWREEDRLENSVVLEIDTDEFGPAIVG